MTNARSTTWPRRRRLLVLLLGSTCLVGGLLQTALLQDRLQCWRIRSLLSDWRLDEAFDLARRYAARRPACAECQFLLAKSARRVGNFSLAGQALQSAQRSGWDRQGIRFEQILAIAQSGQIDTVKRDLQLIFTSNLLPSDTAEVYEAMANGHLAAFDIPEFLKCVEFWLKWRPDAIQPRLMEAALLLRLGRRREAAGQYEALVKNAPDCLAARLGWGESLLALNLASEAAPELQICYDQKPTAKTSLALAKCLVQTGNADEAEAILSRVSESPDVELRSQILEELGRLHLNRNEATEAVRYLKVSTRIMPENSPAWHALSAAYSMLGESEKAADALTLSRETQQRCERLSSIILELVREPESTAHRLEAAEILFQQGMNKDAAAWLKTILTRDSQHQKANRMLASYYRDEGRQELAEKHARLGGAEPGR
jgi:tetratricopeptide (TPR) repeat protein